MATKRKSKKCENHCPKCGSTNIDVSVSAAIIAKEYTDADGRTFIFQDGLCCDCRCKFTEHSAYVETTWSDK